MTRKSEVIFNTREEELSSDVNRLQRLQNRETMDAGQDDSRTDYHRSGTSDAQSFTLQGTVRVRLQRAPTWTPSGALFQSDIGEGEAHFVGAGGGDESAYKVARWAAATVVFAAPHATLARIDTVYAQGGELATDPQTRTILQDPLTQVTAPATVNKTLNPLATLAIATGTANADPHAGRTPIPAGAVALFDVLVGPAATDAAQFRVARVTERPFYEVIGAAHGLIEGITMKCEGPANESAGATPLPDGDFAVTQGLIRAVVNGRLLTGFGGDLTEGFTGANKLAGIQRDPLNDPFGAAVGTNDVPYYVYLVPSIAVSGVQAGGLSASPFVLIESLTTPDDAGHPSANIQGPGGVLFRADALYVGVGFKAQGQTYRKSFYWDGDGWCWAGSSPASTFPGSTGYMFFNETDAGTGGKRTLPAVGFGTDFTLLTRPVIPHGGLGMRAKVLITFNDTVGDEDIQLRQGIAADVRKLRNFFSGSPQVLLEEVDIPSLDISGNLSIFRNAGTGASFINVVANAYRMNVTRLSGGP